VVEGERLMQASGDILLGWLLSIGPDSYEADYYVRQLRDWKRSAEAESMTPQLLADYGRSCGHVLARAHARTGDRHRDRELSRKRRWRRRRFGSVRRGICRTERT